MKLEHFHSDLNRQFPSKDAYHKKPSIAVVKTAMDQGKVVVDGATVICQDKKYIVVVKNISNGLGGNVYRDMYRIIE